MLTETIESIIATKKKELDTLIETLNILRGANPPTRTEPRRTSAAKAQLRPVPRDPVAKAIVEIGAVLGEFTVSELHSHLLTTPKLALPTYRTFRQQVSKGVYDRQIRKIREERRGNRAVGRPHYIYTTRR
jgi:hypothetical protein